MILMLIRSVGGFDGRSLAAVGELWGFIGQLGYFINGFSVKVLVWGDSKVS